MYSNISGVKIKAGKRRENVMDYVRILYIYIVEDFMYRKRILNYIQETVRSKLHF